MFLLNALKFPLYAVATLVLVSFFRGRQAKTANQVRSKQFSLGDFVTYTLLAVLAASYMQTAVFNRPQNVFKQLGLAPTSPCPALRQRLAHFAAKNPDTVPEQGIPLQKIKNSSGFDRKAYYQQNKYGQMDFLVDRFCAFPEDRDVYLKFGETVFLQSISSDFGPRGTSARIAMSSAAGSGLMTEFPDTGYILNAGSALFFTYLPALILVGLITTQFFATDFAPSRVHARPWFVIVLCTMVAADMYWLFTVPTSLNARVTRNSSVFILSPDGTDALAFFADSAEYTRSVLLALALISFIFMDYIISPRQTDVQILQQCVRNQEHLFNNAKNRTMLETAVMTSSSLRDKAVAEWKVHQKIRERVLEDEDLNAKFEDAVKRARGDAWVREKLSTILPPS
ncbi:hypothetical protein LPJ64_001795 [Coemansia asiatica]|uniref:Uncharacterized protein n=1 Tax=Coemansia asiatica TaxID=1052880 RepID=A0A9W7XKP9_9FUNG|nr:hypothetical protein LPJ64_001795 [Coemansia asiatica]